MPRRLRDSKGKVVAIELNAAELARTLAVEVEDLLEWTTTIPAHSGNGETSVYRVKDVQELNLLKKRAALLRTRMNEAAVQAVEEAGLLDSYAALAADCPKGITAHVWRSYALVVLMQVRYGKMIDAEELAQRAGLVDDQSGQPRLDLDLARKHLRLLQGLGYLRVGKDRWAGQWEHRGLPEAWRGA